MDTGTIIETYPWFSFLELQILKLFDPSRKPFIIHSSDFKKNSLKLNCYKEIVASYSFGTDGFFFQTPVAADLLRATVYRSFGITFHSKTISNKLELVLIIRKRNRRIINFHKVDNLISNSLKSKVLFFDFFSN